MTYTCTVAWCSFDGRSESALRRHVRQVHPWLAAREQIRDGYCAPHGARMPHYASGIACPPDSPEAQRAAREGSR